MKRKPEALSQRITFRLSPEDHDKLVEIGLALHLSGAASIIRALIKLNHTHMRREATRAIRQRDRVAKILDAKSRQHSLFGGK